MRKSFVFLLLVASAFSQTERIIPTFPYGIPLEDGGDITPDTVRADVGDFDSLHAGVVAAEVVNVDSGYFDKITLPVTIAGGAGNFNAGIFYLGGYPFIHSYAAPGSDGFNVFTGSNAGNGLLGPNGGASSLGSYNTGTGAFALSDLRTGRYNTANGYRAGVKNTVGSQNYFGGAFAGAGNTSGGNLVYLGFGAGQSSDSAIDVVAVGSGAMANNQANFGVAVGSGACALNTIGDELVCVGYQSLASNTSGVENVGVGSQSLIANTTGSRGSAFGQRALDRNTTGNNNTGIAVNAGYRQRTGNDNFFGGAFAGDGNGFDYSSSGNTGLGAYSLYNIKSGNGYNTAVGWEAGYMLTTGSGNVFYGFRACDEVNTGSRNICIGIDIDAPSTSDSGQLNIGNYIYGSQLHGRDGTISSGKIGIGTKTPRANLEVAGTFLAYDSIQTINNNDQTLSAAANRVVTSTTALTANRTITLLPFSQIGNRCIDFADQGGVVGVNALAIDLAGSDVINGSGTTIEINAAYGSITLCFQTNGRGYIKAEN